jgi:tetratricopeptide (TPR) repeat protein
MAEPAQDVCPLAGQKVAFTGKLAALTLAEAKDLLRACGAEWVPIVTEQTSLLVVGQDALPLRKDGRLTRNLRTARRLQRTHAIVIINEADWLAGLGAASPLGNAAGVSTAQLSQMLQVPGQRIRAWVRAGLIQPAASVLGVHFFDFRQVSWAKTLCRFDSAGVSPERIRRSLEQLRQWLPDVDQPLAQLAVLESEGRLLVRLGGGQLAEATGQGLFDFAEESPTPTLSVGAQPRTSEAYFVRGCELEQAGRLAEAAQAYRLALVFGGPSALSCFNLGNVLYARGQKDEALQRYTQAVECDPNLAAAWLNLGNLLTERQRPAEAVAAYQKVLALEPLSADAHYNLADTLDSLGRQEEALPHWRAYLRQDASSAWGDYARGRVERRAMTGPKR